MTYHIDAIYDNGVLKPLVPLVMPDKSRVRLTVEPAEADGATKGSLRSRFGSIQSGDAHSASNERIEDDLADEHTNSRA
jgi:predicted DNA-binding antitoxin AbrB/MazE fold protein